MGHVGYFILFYNCGSSYQLGVSYCVFLAHPICMVTLKLIFCLAGDIHSLLVIEVAYPQELVHASVHYFQLIADPTCAVSQCRTIFSFTVALIASDLQSVPCYPAWELTILNQEYFHCHTDCGDVLSI